MTSKTRPDRLPPQCLDMEQAVLGAMILDNAAIDSVMAILRPEDFYRDAHRVIFEAIAALHLRHEPVDLLTLTEQLRAKEALAKVGGSPYLVQLTEAVASPSNASYYASRVEGTAALRRLIEAARTIQDKAYEAQDRAPEVLDEAEELIFSACRRRDRKYFAHVREVLDDALDWLDERAERKDAVTGMPSGLTQLDNMTSGFHKSDLIILAARPSMGKTALALSIALNTARRTGQAVAIFSLEMSRQQLCLRVAAHYRRRPRGDRRQRGGGVRARAEIRTADEAARTERGGDQ